MSHAQHRHVCIEPGVTYCCQTRLVYLRAADVIRPRSKAAATWTEAEVLKHVMKRHASRMKKLGIYVGAWVVLNPDLRVGKSQILHPDLIDYVTCRKAHSQGRET